MWHQPNHSVQKVCCFMGTAVVGCTVINNLRDDDDDDDLSVFATPLTMSGLIRLTSLRRLKVYFKDSQSFFSSWAFSKHWQEGHEFISVRFNAVVFLSFPSTGLNWCHLEHMVLPNEGLVFIETQPNPFSHQLISCFLVAFSFYHHFSSLITDHGDSHPNWLLMTSREALV